MIIGKSLHTCSVGIITNNQINAKRDRRALLTLPVAQVAVFDTLRSALDRLNNLNNSVHLFMVDSAAKDYDGCTCVRQLRHDVRFKCLPAVLATHESNYDFVLSAIGAGVNGFVIRPYSVKTLEEHVQMAWETARQDDLDQGQLAKANSLMAEGKFDQAIEQLEEVTQEMNEAKKYFDRGLNYLHKKLFSKAIVAFSTAVKINSMFAEAYGGLARAHKGKGNEEAYRLYMKKAAELYAAQDRLDEMKDMFVEVLKQDPDAINPFNSMGLQLRRDGNLKGALEAYERALTLTPMDEHLHFNIANAYVLMENHKDAVSFLRKALVLNPHFDKAQDLLRKIQHSGPA